MKLVYGILFGLIGQIGSFLQLQGSIKLGWLPKYMWLVLLASIPLSWCYIKSVEYFIAYFDGQLWPSRLLGFGLGIAVFSIMSLVLFKEPFTQKTIVCLILGFSIILIQILWK